MCLVITVITSSAILKDSDQLQLALRIRYVLNKFLVTHIGVISQLKT